MCRTCKVPEDTEHFFLHCNRYITQRHFLFSNIEAILHEKNIPHQDVISNLQFLSENRALPRKTREEILYAIEQFLKDTKRFM